MKTNKLTIILLIIIFILGSFIVYDKVIKKELDTKKEAEITLKDTIKFDYVTIYLLSDGIAYLTPLNKEEVKNLKLDKNLTDRLNTLYDRSFYYDIYLNNQKLRAFRIKLDSNIIKMKQIEAGNLTYIVFLKENNTVGLFSYEDYIDLLYTDAVDNYNNLKNVADVKDNEVIYLDGSKEEFIRK